MIIVMQWDYVTLASFNFWSFGFSISALELTSISFDIYVYPKIQPRRTKYIVMSFIC